MKQRRPKRTQKSEGLNPVLLVNTQQNTWIHLTVKIRVINWIQRHLQDNRGTGARTHPDIKTAAMKQKSEQHLSGAALALC